ncbi:hypothetical protein E2C01_010048 [Portunus trituberculatus]|uniref:Uncharacterized protein n=1 Tax=Portunus trituberculatus TaxID=210409 RepID=A0A5B7D7D6_PORTR|nr:hypothetical protein [Portunus trituberculatus]
MVSLRLARTLSGARAAFTHIREVAYGRLGVMEKDSIGQSGLSCCGIRLSLLLLVTMRLAVVSSKDNNLCEYP